MNTTFHEPNRGLVALTGQTYPLDTLRVILKGGPLDGETRDVGRDTRELTFGSHREPHFSILNRYKRTISIDAATGRTVFEHTEQALLEPPPQSRPLRYLRNAARVIGLHQPSLSIGI